MYKKDLKLMDENDICFCTRCGLLFQYTYKPEQCKVYDDIQHCPFCYLKKDSWAYDFLWVSDYQDPEIFHEYELNKH